MAELAPIHQEFTDLRIKIAEARIDAQEVGEKLVALLERTRVDEAEAERLWKEWDDLLQTLEGFCTVCDLCRQERADAQQQIDLLRGKLEEERDLKVDAEGVTTRLATEVDRRQEEI